MGAQCSCSDSTDKTDELITDQHQRYLKNPQSGVKLDEQTERFLHENTHLIVRVQAFYRGRLARRRLFGSRKRIAIRGLLAPRSLLSYASDDEQFNSSRIIGEGQLHTDLSHAAVQEEQGVEFRAEHTFESGAVYKGQWQG